MIAEAATDYLQMTSSQPIAVDFEQVSPSTTGTPAGHLAHLSDVEVRGLLEAVLLEGVGRGFGLTWWSV